jgi:N-acetylglutamate synthase-like GNAT family acetyltransferase
MRARSLTIDDLPKVQELHDKYFGQDFKLPNFFHKFLNAFAIVDDNDKIIIAGGVRPIAETIIVTDKENSGITLGRALVEAQAVSIFTCQKFEIDYLHAFVKDEKYAEHLKQHGFHPRCQALSMRVSDGRR